MSNAGRPTSYKPEYDDMLIAHMAQGYSYASFAGVVGCHFDTLYNWEKLQPQFSEAKKVGTAKCLKFWEGVGIQASLGAIEGFSAAAWVFNMKNRFGWRDQKHEETGGKEGATTLKYAPPVKRVSA